MARLTNDIAELTPRISFDGRELRFDFPGLEIGVAEYDEDREVDRPEQSGIQGSP